MFTGIIEEVGVVENIQSLGGGLRFRITAPGYSPELKINDSVSVNGACHTVVWRNESSFDIESVEETLKKTSLGALAIGDKVNLELPMKLNERLGGHLVLGHVDTTGVVISVEPRTTSWMFFIAIPEQFQHYVVPVGSISVDGVSLTVAELRGSSVGLSIIPHTMDHTIFRYYTPGRTVNLEFDLIGKYIERLMAGRTSSAAAATPAARNLTEQDLRESGY